MNTAVESGAESRALAAEGVAAVVGRGRSLGAVLPTLLARAPARDVGLLQELCYGTLRWYPALDRLLGRLLHRPLPAREQTLHALLLVGLYQLHHLRLPAYAAVAATVAASRTIGRARSAGLVNAVLRNAQRRHAELARELAADAEFASAHPRWLLEALREAWPLDWQSLVTANNARPPLGLRVNLSRIDRVDYLSRLRKAGIEAQPDPQISSAVVLDEARDVATLPGFAQGLVSVQDPAAQLAAGLLELAAGQRVLDGCAAPGGKTGHLLEVQPGIDLLALDSDAARLDRVRENLDRLGVQAGTLAADATRPDDWWDGRAFDRILLDVPCTGTGVIRRHPDIKLLRRAGDAAEMAAHQAALLRSLWALLQPGGLLLYVTCSVLPVETQRVIADFLAGQTDAIAEPIAPAWGRESGAGRQLLPGEYNRDGFFYARLRKSL